MNELLTPVANVGFPIVLSIYLLVRLEGKIEGLSDSVHELARSISGLGNRQP
ncbi:MAG: YvrJ family protein [Bacillota bacterium]|nr:YvrJ family protein [Bacillota bacterium]MDW7678543.1 YvrJ family protein [Bacillota bacterium]